MLIRSRDKEILINLDRIGAIAKSKDNHIVASESVMPRPSEILDIGEYSTESKAIRVLDVINDGYYNDVSENKVFEMSSDKEVEG